MSKDRRTVLVTNPGSDLYGSDRMLLETVKALLAADLRVIVTVPQTGPLVDLLQESGAEVIQQSTPVIRKSSLTPTGLIRLATDTFSALLPSWDLLRRSLAGTVLVNTITTPLWFPLARLAGLRVVCHLHEAEGAVPAPVRWAMHAPLQFCHQIIANSSYTKTVLTNSSRGLTSRVAVIHNTVPGPQVVEPPRSALDGGVRLLFVGRLSHRKGPHVAVSAVSLLRDRGIHARLDIVGAIFPGNEKYKEELEQTVLQLGVLENVRFHGFKECVWPYFAACDIVLVPSVGEESFGNTAVEAALAARPVAASNNAGLKEATAASESAELVPPDDPEALSLAVEQIIQNWDNYATAAVADSSGVSQRFSAMTYKKSLIHVLGLDAVGSLIADKD